MFSVTGGKNMDISASALENSFNEETVWPWGDLQIASKILLVCEKKDMKTDKGD